MMNDRGNKIHEYVNFCMPSEVDVRCFEIQLLVPLFNIANANPFFVLESVFIPVFHTSYVSAFKASRKTSIITSAYNDWLYCLPVSYLQLIFSFEQNSAITWTWLKRSRCKKKVNGSICQSKVAHQFVCSLLCLACNTTEFQSKTWRLSNFVLLECMLFSVFIPPQRRPLQICHLVCYQ